MALGMWVGGCGPSNSVPTSVGPVATQHQRQHKHVPPHGGTPIVLGKEEFHLEMVLDEHAGKLSAYVMDGELENFVRVTAASFTVQAKLADRLEFLTFKAVTNTATGETVGDTALFEATAAWLKTNKSFDGTLTELAVRTRRFVSVEFNFPKGNDHD